MSGIDPMTVVIVIVGYFCTRMAVLLSKAARHTCQLDTAKYLNTHGKRDSRHEENALCAT